VNADAPLAQAFEAHRTFLWALSYRLTGNAADADDIVQETFVRALQHPPARAQDPWRPWLVRVALNLGRDVLRRRRRRDYVGPWLPSPVPTGDEASAEPAAEPSLGAADTPAARYDRLESVSFAFLVALEELTPVQRAALLLRDVFDYTVRETAGALEMTEAAVKAAHLRARKAMSGYERSRRRPTRALQQRTREALERFLALLEGNDVDGLQSLLADDVRAVHDAGGEFTSALRPIVGRDKVIRLYASFRQGLRGARLRRENLNGLPALVLEFEGPPPRHAPPRVVFQCELDAEGRIGRFYSVLASRKVKAVPAT
jgi:RNA polymerase sigma-70 factor (ECF subfamily)